MDEIYTVSVIPITYTVNINIDLNVSFFIRLKLHYTFTNCSRGILL